MTPSTFTGTYVITQVDIDAGNRLNTATADSDESDPADGPADPPLPIDPALTLDKTFTSYIDADGSGTVTQDDTLTYSFIAENTGNQTLTGVTITDPLAGLSALTCSPTQPSTLAPGFSMACTVSLRWMRHLAQSPIQQQLTATKLVRTLTPWSCRLTAPH